MERAYMAQIASSSDSEREAAFANMQSHVVYADPMDLTKMLDKAPGTQILDGVRVAQQNFYPA